MRGAPKLPLGSARLYSTVLQQLCELRVDTLTSGQDKSGPKTASNDYDNPKAQIIIVNEFPMESYG